MTDMERILQAIASQRWFFFSNNDKILFDKLSALIWTNLEHFPYNKADGMTYSNIGSYSEVKKLVNEKNSSGFGGFNDWKVPTNRELWKMISDKSFSFQNGRNWRIKRACYWCVKYNGMLQGKDLDDEGATEDISSFYDVAVILCSSKFIPKNFLSTPKEILDIFIGNGLVPIFNDSSTNKLYEEHMNRTIAQKKLIPNFDYLPLLAQYDMSTLEKSAIKYFKAVLSVTDELLKFLQEYEVNQAETIAEYLKIALKLNENYIDNINLTPEENNLFAEHQKYLSKRLELGTDSPKQKILLVKEQAENFFNNLDKINSGNDSIRQLARLQAEPRADFEFLVENMAKIIIDAQDKVNFFTENKNFVENVIKSQIEWSENYTSFKTILREKLSAVCCSEGIDTAISSAWYDDWNTKRLAIERRLIPLIEFALKGNFSDVFNDVLKILLDYRDSVDEFYLYERKNIYQKFELTSDGDLQDKLETENELNKLSEKLRCDLQRIISSLDNIDERKFLLSWSEPLLNNFN